ncbi:MAG: lipocalin-like domain-containing protein, partial [Gemmatimonadota bacterium]
KAAAFDGYTAYFGKYSVREAEGVVTHQRIGHLVPNQATLAVERQFEFVNDMLVLAVPGWNRLVWKRVN